jgi:hypothetical protein
MSGALTIPLPSRSIVSPAIVVPAFTAALVDAR